MAAVRSTSLVTTSPTPLVDLAVRAGRSLVAPVAPVAPLADAVAPVGLPCAAGSPARWRASAR